ncbi:MAG: transglutaminaseTgpA domain-containing protein [Thermoleophilaceae bacterium]
MQDLAPVGRLGIRLVAFGALSIYVVGHWGGLVEAAPTSRLAAVAAIATGAGALLVATARLGGVRGTVARAAVAVAALAAGLAVVGLDARLLLPGNWDELGEGLDQGLAGLRTVDWPYGGSDEWVRQVLLLGAPALAVTAGLLAFWPARRGAGLLRALGLVLLLVVYGVAVTERDFGAELLRGAGLALLVGLWLWAPHSRGREAGAVALVVASATLFAVPVASSLDREAPWLDYRQWNWFGTIGGTAFDWSHSYGPIDWSRDGTTVLRVKAERALYWKVEVQDRFDGFRWVRSGAGAETPPGVELPQELNPAWEESAEFTVRELRSDLAVVTGTPLRVEGLGATDTAVDGTTSSREGQLREGESYSVSAYVPNPSRRQLRATPEHWSDYFRRYLRIDLPPEGVTNLEGTGRAGDAARSAVAPAATVAMPFRGDVRPPETAATELLLLDSPYRRTFGLAQRLTAGAPTTYDAVKAIESHLLENFRYSERPPSQEYPLEAFLFEDRAGYCQQFSGAMALMLRMVGIPARVVGGFAPGSFNRDEDEFRVRDLDAHSWVEVHFSGLGWIQFDPTPSGAPAGSRAEPREAASSATGSTDPGRGEGVAAERESDTGGGAGATGGDGDALPFWAVPAMLGGLVAAGILAAWLLAAIQRRRDSAGAEGPLRELTRALGRLGYPLPAHTTLLALERRLARAVGPCSAAYVRALRDVRYGGNGAVLPGPAQRRALRGELARRRGLLGRLRGWAALPPFRRS